jgi:hypothetical protein
MPLLSFAFISETKQVAELVSASALSYRYHSNTIGWPSISVAGVLMASSCTIV